MPRLLLVLLLVAGCSSTPNIIEEQYPPPYQRQPFTDYKVEGVSLWRVIGLSMPDRNGPDSVVGVDPEGNLIAGQALFVRAAADANLDAKTLARRAFDMLLARAWEHPVAPANRVTMFSDEEWALVREPAQDAGVLEFWYIEGEMSPQLMRGRVALATGVLTRTAARELVVAPGVQQLQPKLE